MARYATSEVVRKLVARYCREVKGRTATFTVIGPFDWSGPIPAQAATGGCYAIYGESGALLYVGMSERRIDARIDRHHKTAAKLMPFWKIHPPGSYDLIPELNPWDEAGLEIYLTKMTRRMNLLKTPRKPQ